MNDERIIDLFFQRSEEAIRALDQTYGKLCRQIAGNILQDHHDAEECVNDAYFGLWNAIPPARPDPLRAYLCRVVRNISLDRYHKNSAAKRNGKFDAALSELEQVLSAPNTVESELEGKELTRLLEQFLDTQTEENRVIFLRRYWFYDSYEEIARQTGLAEKTVSVRLVRIRKKLRKWLSERGFFYG
ncbi:MAG: sigma-70 family RNA polymerase sigma factor [Clostridiales bacterium]|nr:sigma-70 family RNA polymerase sigma factor [Clostridiales bacterium]